MISTAPKPYAHYLTLPVWAERSHWDYATAYNAARRGDFEVDSVEPAIYVHTVGNGLQNQYFIHPRATKKIYTRPKSIKRRVSCPENTQGRHRWSEGPGWPKACSYCLLKHADLHKE